MEVGDIEILTNNFSPKNMEDIRKHLLDALERRDFQSFKQIVEENSNTLSVNEIITYVGSDEKDTYLDIACRENLKEFVEFLLDNGAEINRVNDEYDCAPIHFAVKGGYVDILKILLRPSRDVIHREAEQQIDPNLEVEQRTALHIAVEKNYEDCAALLLKKGASANILNSKNQTALHVAARKGQLDMVMLILDNCTERLKVDRYKDYEHKTTRQVIVKKWPYMENKLLIRIPIEGENLEKDLTVQDLKYHLNNRDKESFRDHMKIIQEQIPPHIAQTLLTVSVQHNFQQAVTAILEKFETRPLNMTKALYMSIQKGHYDIFEELLKAGPQLTKSQSEDLILKICQEMGIPKEGEVDNTNLLKCLELMLKQKNADVCRPDNTKMVKFVRQSAYGGNLRIEEAFQQIEEIQESDQEDQEIKDCTNDSKIQDHLLNVYDDICGLSSINEEDFYKLLKCALRFNNFSYFEKAINYGKQHAVFNVNYVYPNGTEETLLDKASRNGQTNFVKLLLKEGAKVNRINKMHNRAPIHFATEGGHANTLAALLKEPTINPNLQVGHQTALHIAVRRNDPVCTCLLLNNDARPDIPNSKGLTALHLAALRNNREIVKLILKKRRNRYLNIDTCKDYKNQTTREVIQQKLPDILLPPKCKSQEINVYNLKYYLIANDESSFLKRIEFVNILHPNVGEELLEIAVQHNFYKTVIEILEILKKKQFSVKKAAEEAVLQSHSAILQELLSVEPEIANDLVFSVCQQLGIPDERRKDNNAERLKCVQLVLEQKGVDVRRTDSKGNTPLHYVARAGYTEAIILLLHRGSYIGHMNKFNVPPIADIPACTLTNYFDELVDVREIRKEKMNEMIKFDYRFLMPHDVQKKHDENHQTTREMEVIQYIASNKDLKHLLKHPVLSSFLYLKWNNIKDILFLYFFFFVIYYTLLVVYLSIPANENKTQIINNNFNIIRKNYQQISCIFLRIFISLLLLPFISWETFQFISRPWHYLRNVKNLLLNNTLIVLTVVLICGVNHYIVNTILILLSFWKLIILNNQYKDMFISFERNIEFQMTSMTSIKYSVYLLYVIFISTSFQAVYVVFTLFEINANFFNSRNHIMIVLLFFFFILLFNVLNASKINTAENLKKAELTRFISWIDVIAHIENMTVDRYYFCCGKSRWNPFNSLLCKTIFLFPHNLKNDIYIQH